MNAKVSANTRTKAGRILTVIAAAAALLVGSASVLAESHGGGGGGGHGGGHMGGGGGHAAAPHFGGGGRAAGGAHFAGGGARFAGGAHYAPRFSSGNHAQARFGGGYGHGYGYGIHGGVGYGSRAGWGGGYWRGGYWPRANYGWSYPLYLGLLPALYSTYWWSGVPYYYVNDVYYNWSATDNGYVAVDPPPVDADYSDDVNAAAAAGPDAASADNTPPDVAPTGPEASVIAYPRNGQSDQQQATDKFQCHDWAKGQSGFDPTSQASSGAAANVRAAYGRALAACLDGRGYTVR